MSIRLSYHVFGVYVRIDKRPRRKMEISLYR